VTQKVVWFFFRVGDRQRLRGGARLERELDDDDHGDPKVRLRRDRVVVSSEVMIERFQWERQRLFASDCERGGGGGGAEGRESGKGRAERPSAGGAEEEDDRRGLCAGSSLSSLRLPSPRAWLSFRLTAHAQGA